MNAALAAAVSELGGTGRSEMAQAILRFAARGSFSETELKQVAFGKAHDGLT